MKIKFDQEITIGNRLIGGRAGTFIVAEAGVNHGGDMALAKRLIDLAVRAGVDAVKFQAFRTEQLILKNVAKAPYQKRTTEPGESQYEMLKKLELDSRQYREIASYCRAAKIVLLITPFDEVSLDELDALDLPAYKIASTDLTNLPFLKKVAQKNKPVLLSTGMSYLPEIEAALKEISKYNTQVVLLQCGANYPLGDDEANLRVIETFRRRFNVLVGFSDHTRGLGATPYAVALGACVVEKHFTYDKRLPGPDHRASLSPSELARLVKEIRKVERYLGAAVKEPSRSEQGTRLSLQKYLVAARNIRAGEAFSSSNLIAKRTGGLGISPIKYYSVLGKRAKKSFHKDEIITL